MLNMLNVSQQRVFVNVKNLTLSPLEVGMVISMDDRDIIEYVEFVDRVILMNRGFMGRVDERIKPQHYGLVELILD